MLRTARGAAGALCRIPGVERNGPAPLARTTFSHGFLDFKKTGNKKQETIEKEKARLKDEMSRGYFADIAKIRKNSGKIAAASKVIIPEVDVVKFPDLAMESPDGGSLCLPLVAPSPEGVDHEARDAVVPDASLVCLSFRASSQKMAESWSLPFLDAFGAANNIPVYEVMRKSNNPQRHTVYAFGDHYDFRKKLDILNLLTGYIYLVDCHGRIRWQGFGSATEVELSSLTACTSILLDGK